MVVLKLAILTLVPEGLVKQPTSIDEHNGKWLDFDSKPRLGLEGLHGQRSQAAGRSLALRSAAICALEPLET